MWILVLVLFSVVVALLSYLDMKKPKNYPPGNYDNIYYLYIKLNYLSLFKKLKTCLNY